MRYDQKINQSSRPIHQLRTKNAFHVSGHAAAMYLGNKQKGLPPIFFRIVIKTMQSEFQSTPFVTKHYGTSFAEVEGGRLIQDLPASIDEVVKGFSIDDKLAYEQAFESDIINLLAGPLAEAKYVALKDNEMISPRLINVNALNYYDGASDLETVREYLDRFVHSKDRKEEKMTEFFLEAYDFVSDQSNWHAITRLANYLLTNGAITVECDEIITVLENESCFSLEGQTYHHESPLSPDPAHC